MNSLTYSESGVNIFAEEKAIKNLLSSLKFNRLGIGRYIGGHFAGLIDFNDLFLVLSTDGVGSKVMIANDMKKWDTVGIDCIAMNVNDCLCVGAEPVSFVDYLAMENVDPDITREIGKGLSRGAEIANVSIAGGETATLPDIIRGFDLAGTCLGYVKKDRIIMGDKIQEGDIIIGLESSGLHSNGFTLVRKIMKISNLSYDQEFPDGIYDGKTIGEILLEPTRIYVREVLEVIKKFEIHGLAHITGGGLRNLTRLKDVKFVIDNPIDPQPIFDFIQKRGKVDLKEMYQTFNMGMGFSIISPREYGEDIIDLFDKTDIKAKIVGYIERGRGVDLPTLNISYQ